MFNFHFSSFIRFYLDFVADPNLCSHLYALCFLTESIFAYDRIYAKRCSEVCPHLDVFQIAKLFDAIDGNLVDENDDSIPNKIEIGMNIPKRFAMFFSFLSFCHLQCHAVLVGAHRLHSFTTHIFLLLYIVFVNSARGSYCLSTAKPPFCKTQPHQIGSSRCCSLTEMFS